MKTLFDFDDLALVPEVMTSIETRQAIKYTDSFGKLPIISAPMDTVVTIENIVKFGNRIHVCLPRGDDKKFINKDAFHSYSLAEVEELVRGNNELQYPVNRICIDVANGHMKALYKVAEKFKEKYPHVEIMVGNIANPETYRVICYDYNGIIDYIRVGIGAGSGCLTSEQTAINYPMASLISECGIIKNEIQFNFPNWVLPKIVADGGIRKYADIIKSLALGADYVMIGGLLNKMIQSAGDKYLFNLIKVSQDFAEKAYAYKLPVYVSFRGMSTKEVQRKWGKEILTTAEGISKRNRVQYDFDKWADNFRDYLRSAMSYQNCESLEQFINNGEFSLITPSAFKRFNK